MAKDLESLQESRDQRGQIQLKYGFIPTSIITADKSDRANDVNAEERSYANVGFHDPEMSNKLNRAFETNGRSCRGGFDVSGQCCRDGALSRFPQNVGRYLVKMYTEKGDTVLDPFSGHNSRMQCVWELERNYIGYDVGAKFMAANHKIRDELLAENTRSLLPNAATIELHQEDSQNIKVISPADMVLTSPPYWDLEYYVDEIEQLGKYSTYNNFLHALETIIKNTVACLKPGGFCCFCINDFRKDGIFYPYHADIIRSYQRVGLALHDVIIVDLGPPISAAFASQLEEQKRTAKRHEYCIVGRK